MIAPLQASDEPGNEGTQNGDDAPKAMTLTIFVLSSAAPAANLCRVRPNIAQS